MTQTSARGDKRFNFVIFVVWSTIIVGRWLVVAWGGHSCFSLAEMSFLVFLVLFKEVTKGEFRVSSLGGLWRKRCCDHNGGTL